MSKLLKQILAVALAFQTSLSGISTIVHAEEPEETPEYTAETIADEEEEAILSEEGDEENVIVIEQEEEEEPEAPTVEEGEEEPPVTEEPEVTEEPQETDTPEVTEPQEPEEPVVTEEPEETETPEITEPEETETPAVEEPEETEEPGEVVEVEEITELDDTELMSEPLSAHDLDEDDTLLDIVNANKTLPDTLKVTALWKSSAPTNVYLIAENKTTRYFLAKYEMPPTNTPFTFGDITPGLPEGEYTLRVATNNALFAKPTLSVSPAFSRKLRILPAPDITVSKLDDGSWNGELKVKLPDMTYIDKLVFNSENFSDITRTKTELVNGAVKGEYTYTELPSDWYHFWYEGVYLSDVIVLTGGTTNVSIPKTIAPVAMQSHIFKNGTGYGSSAKPFVMTYIGETAQITSEMDSGDPFEEVDDTRLTYKSGNTKVVTVDAVGNVKATGKGETQITVTSKADPTLQTFVYVKVEPVTPKSFAFDRTKITDSLSLTDIYYALNGYEHYPIYELQLNTTGLPDDAEIPVTYRVYGGDGLKIYEGYGTDTNPAYYENPHIGEGYALYSGMIRYNSASIKLMATEGGVYTVTATAQGKTASCKVTVDGFDHLHIYSTVVEITKDSSLYISGKQITGFVRIESDSYVLGADALKEVDGETIIYLDPSTKHPVGEGIHKIGKKAYYFDSLLQIPNGNVNNWNTVYFGTSLEPEYIFVQKDGSLGTGWQGVDTDYSGEPDEMHYFDPSSYLMVKKNWVPVRSGKGVTWVNSEGKALDDYGYSLDNNGASYQDDFHKIDGNFYVFNGGYKKGARQTGWVYLKYDSGHVVLATEKTGTMKVYCDPNNNGQVATGAFWVNGKEYQGETISVGYGPDTIEANVYLPGPQLKAQYGIKNVKYMWSSTYGRSFILGLDGSIVKNKLVQAYNPLVHETAWMYAKADGSPAMEEWISVGGKSYYFDDNGIYDPEGVAASDSGLFVYSGSGSKMEVYCRPVDAKKPSSGYYYYDTEKTKLKNILLFDEFDQPILALDKNGKAAVNTVISASTKQGGEKKTYITLKDGSVYWNTYPTSGYNFLTAEVKGKLYAINPEDYSVLKGGLVPISWNDSHEVEAFGLADKNGVLKRNAFGNAQINGTTYTLYFEEDGEASWEDVPVIKGKPYMTQKITGTSGIYNGFDFYTIYKPLKEGWFTGGDTFYVNKDGSIKLGLLTKPNGKKMYVALRGGHYLSVLDCWNIAPYPTLWKINNKLYLFNQNCEAVTGWVYFEKVIISDLAKEEYLEAYDDVLIYFDPKTCAAVTGGWKTVPKPVFRGMAPAFGVEDIAVPESHGYETFAVNASSATGKLYFSKDGILTRNTEMTISRKSYMFGPDGSYTRKTGWTDANKMYYIGKNSQLAKGRKKIDGQYYYFDETGRKQTDRLIKSGKKWYYYDSVGVQATPAMSIYMSGDYLYGSPTGVDLTAVWAKDGSLTKIVYTTSGKPAAGETINFGYYDYDYDIYSSYVLDSKGLPKTGAVYDIYEGGYTNSYLYNTDGSIVSVGSEGYYSLVKNGKKYYVLDDSIIQTQNHVTAVSIDGNWNTLNDKDKKTVSYFGELGYNRGKTLYVLVNPDGSVVSDKAVRATVNGITKLWYTNRMGIPMNYYTYIFKFGGKWYADGISNMLTLYGGPAVRAQIRVKTNGELIGFYNAETGKAISGMYGDEDFVISLNKGKPQTGNRSFNGRNYYFDPQVGAYLVHP